MHHLIHIVALALLLAPLAAHAQSRGCIERPVGPPVDGAARGSLPHAPRGRGVVAVPQVPSHGTECIAVMPPVRDVLRGDPAPAGGLLR